MGVELCILALNSKKKLSAIPKVKMVKSTLMANSTLTRTKRKVGNIRFG
jgi:hypothetical protein